MCKYVSSYHYTCVLMLLHTCTHTSTYVFACHYNVSAYYRICALILLHTCRSVLEASSLRELTRLLHASCTPSTPLTHL